MSFLEWSKSRVDYGRRLVDSAVEGARTGEDEFLKEEALAPHFERSARQALAPAVIGAYVGLLSASLRSRHRSATRALAYGFLGGAIGFGAGVIWENRQLTASVASGAWKHITTTRDQHWFEKNPIDYA
jgi:hypothetical protein